MSTVRLGALVAAVGGALLMLSEIVEVVGGGFSPTHFALTIAAFFVLSVGIWGLHAGQAPKGGRLSLVGAALFSAGAFLEGVADAISFGAVDEAAVQAQTGLLVPVAFTMIVFGGAAFGVSVLRAGVYPAWQGVLTMLAPPVLPIVTIAGLPFVLTSVANAALGAAVLSMGFYVLTGQARSTRGVA